MSMKIVTNNVPRDVIHGFELTPAERAEFDYLNWESIERGEDDAQFFRYKGQLHDLGEFSADYGITKGSGFPEVLHGWDGYRSDSFFSALAVRYVEDYEQVVVALVLS